MESPAKTFCVVSECIVPILYLQSINYLLSNTSAPFQPSSLSLSHFVDGHLGHFPLPYLQSREDSRLPQVTSLFGGPLLTLPPGLAWHLVMWRDH